MSIPNKFAIGIQGDTVVILKEIPAGRLSGRDALILAAWLVACAGAASPAPTLQVFEDFQRIYEEVCNQ